MKKLLESIKISKDVLVGDMNYFGMTGKCQTFWEMTWM